MLSSRPTYSYDNGWERTLQQSKTVIRTVIVKLRKNGIILSLRLGASSHVVTSIAPICTIDMIYNIDIVVLSKK